jgi:hypothetical protein
MAVNRYKNINPFINAVLGYKKAFPKRYGETGIRQLPVNTLTFPTVDEEVDFEIVTEVWGQGDRFYKLARTYYNSPQYWWVIALYNKKPTEQHVKIGDLIEIPLPLDQVLTSYGL